MKNRITTLCLAASLVTAAASVLTLSGCAGDRYDRSTGEYIDDKALESRVRSALGDSPAYKFDDVRVTSFRGTVQLSGFVNTDDQRARAAEIAKNVQGVKRVENKVTVKP